ncbi:MAG TPA: zinc ribbon domain-containing protein [Smithellaceae bacterium]|nr:zinc ribbon domain-containing protein [Smithellaceae bacterium]HRS90096.1 zinc ribbon domain-containing protein [Smithellaceae bacterium]HRV26946.1 zinc ribbon domain-containing protein [Smithellaceae bacterium]
MPIYEFYCKRCNTIYNFFTPKVNTNKIPSCPKCKRTRLVRQISLFSTLSAADKTDEDNPLAGLDAEKVEKELAKAAAAAENMNGEDPRAAAQLMRKFSESTGMKMGDVFYEALRRIEKGEDPEKVEEEMGDALMQEAPLAGKLPGKSKAKQKPNVDEKLYEL